MTDDRRSQVPLPHVYCNLKDSSHNDLNCNCKQCTRNGPYSCGNLPKTLFWTCLIKNKYIVTVYENARRLFKLGLFHTEKLKWEQNFGYHYDKLLYYDTKYGNIGKWVAIPQLPHRSFKVEESFMGGFLELPKEH